MKALILPKIPLDGLKPLTAWTPEYLLPVVNKPVGEHLVEWLVRHGIKEIIMVLKHMPFETEKYFGDGARWGARISYFLQKDYTGLADILTRLGSKVDGPVLCLPGNKLTDLDLSSFIDVQRKSREEIAAVRPCPANVSGAVRAGTAEDWQGLDDWPCIVTQGGLSLMSQSVRQARQDDSRPSTGIGRQPLQVFEAPFRFHEIKTPIDYVETNLRALKGEFEGLIIPGRPIKPGVFVGKHTRIHPSAVLSPPVLIGDYCIIGRNCSIGEGAIVCNRVVIDERVSVLGSMVLSHTYLGPYADVRNAVVNRNCLLQIPTLQEVCMGDDLILGDLSRATLSARAERLWNVLLALFFIALTFPVTAFYCLRHLAHPSRRLFESEKRYGGVARRDLGGKRVWKDFDMYSFKSNNRIIQKLPGLTNVLKGDLNLVGVSVLTREELEGMLGEWLEIRSNAPAGLFRPWEAEMRRDLDWEEKMVIETYYAATRSFRGDFAILVKSLFR